MMFESNVGPDHRSVRPPARRTRLTSARDARVRPSPCHRNGDQILELFDRHPPEARFKLALRDMDLNGFLDRAIKVIGGDLTGKAPLDRAVSSPSGTQQPRDFMCQ